MKAGISQHVVCYTPRCATFILALSITCVLVLGCILTARWRVEIDISTGKSRHTQYVYGVPVSSASQHTAISSVLEGRNHGPEEWKVDSDIYLLSSHSPNYTFHGAHAQIARICVAWELGQFTHEAKVKSASDMLYLWQHGGPQATVPYLQYLNRVADAAYEARSSVKESEISVAPF